MIDRLDHIVQPQLTLMPALTLPTGVKNGSYYLW